MNRSFTLLSLFCLCNWSTIALCQTGLTQTQQGRTDALRVDDTKDKGVSLDREFIFESELEIADDHSKAVACDAAMFLEYDQHDNEIQVETTISTSDCAVTYGEYVIRVNYQDVNDELKTLKFTEAWDKNSKEDYVVQRSYEVGNGVYVSRVRGALSPTNSCQCKTASSVDANH